MSSALGFVILIGVVCLLLGQTNGAPPSFISRLPDHVVVKNNANTTLKCEADPGVNPKVEILWYMNGKPLKPELELVSLNEGRTQLTLFILNANRDNAGELTCILRNSEGQVNSTTFLVPEESQFLFTRHEEFVYKYHAEVTTGTHKPARFGTFFQIDANLHVKPAEEEEQAFIFQLRDISHASYNGPMNSTRQPLEALNSVKLPDKAADLGKPFVVTYGLGKVETVRLGQSEPLWSRNMKRSIAAQFQLDLKPMIHLTSTVFETKEASLQGECKVRNTVSELKKGSIELRKFTSSSQCTKRELMLEIPAMKDCQDTKIDQGQIFSSNERVYSLQVEKDKNRIYIQNLRSRSAGTLDGGDDGYELFFHLVRQSAALQSRSPISDTKTAGVPSFISSLTFEMPQVQVEGAEPDFTFGRTKTDMGKIKHLILVLFKNISNSAFEAPHDFSSEPEKLHNMDLQLLLWHLRFVDKNTLASIASQVMMGTSLEAESKRQIFLQILSKIGTRAALQTIGDLVTSPPKKSMILTSEQIQDLVIDLPFYLRHPDVGILSDCKWMLTLMNEEEEQSVSGVLAFATLVNRVCSKPGVCPPALIEQYAKLFFTRLRDSKEYKTQALYVLALTNLELEPVGDFLEPLILGTFGHSMELRHLALFHAKSIFLTRGTDNVFKTFLPMLADSSEKFWMRTAALTLLIESAGASDDRIMSMFWLLTGDKDERLYSCFHSALNNLAKSTFPCHQTAAKAASHISRLLPESLPDPSLICNGEADLNNILGQKEGAVIKYSAGKRNKNGMSFFGAEVLRSQAGRMQTVGTLYSRGSKYIVLLEAIIGILNDNPYRKIKEPEETSELEKILKEMNLLRPPTSNQEKEDKSESKLELVFSMQDKVISFINFDASIEEVLNMEVIGWFQNMLESRRIMVDINEAVQRVTPSDLGLPLILETFNPWQFSTNLAAGMSRIMFEETYRADVAVKLQSLHNVGMRSLNPFTGAWQGVVRHEAEYLATTFNGTLDTYGPLRLNITWQPDHPLFVWSQHSRTLLFMAGRGTKETLQLSCPTCREVVEVTTGQPRRNTTLYSQLGLQVDLFDCQEKQDIENQMNPVLKTFSKKLEKLFKMSGYLESFEQAVLKDNFLNAELKGTCGMKMVLFPTISKVGHIGITDATSFNTESLDKEGKFFLDLLFFLTLANSEGKPVYSSIYQSEISLVGFDVEPGSHRDLLCTHGTCTVPFLGGFPKSLSVWSFLASPPPSESVARIYMCWGEDESGQCPYNGSSFTLTLRSEALDDDLKKKSWPREQCERDRAIMAKHGEYPATVACLEAARAGLTDRSYDLAVSYSKLPFFESLSKYLPLKFVQDDLETQFISQGGQIDQYEVSWGKGGTGPIKLEEPVKDEGYLANLLVMPKNRQNFISFKAPTCVLSADRVLTFDNSSFAFSPSPNYTLAVATCNVKYPNFGIWLRRQNEGAKLEVKIHVKHDSMTLVPGDEGQAVKINYVHFQTRQEEVDVYRHFDGSVEIRGRRNLHQLQVAYHGHALLISGVEKFGGRLCGLCGDFDGHQDSELESKTPQELKDLYTVK